jgi:rSAM/selenodomain-associated transferase 1
VKEALATAPLFNGGGPKIDTCIFIMAKYPSAGKVKTRLGETLGHETVAHLYQCFLKDTIEKVNHLGTPFFIYYTSDDKKEDFEQLIGNNFNYVPQKGDDLGKRIYQGFKISFKMGFTSAIALASDIPDLPTLILEEALQKLKEYDSVIGPSLDGGYYLIGLRSDALSQNLFQGITWSSETVFNETMEKIEERKISYHPLVSWGDVDLIDDLERLLSSRDPIFHRSLTWKYLKSTQII